MPQPYSDPSFEAFRKEIADIASRKDRAALAKLVANNFFWMSEKGDKANKRKSGIDNLAAAIDLDGKEGDGWEVLTEAAKEATLEPVPNRRGVMCGPAGPSFDAKAAMQTARATGFDVSDWGFPLKGGADVLASAQANAQVVEKIGSILVRVMAEEPPPGAGNAPSGSVPCAVTLSARSVTSPTTTSARLMSTSSATSRMPPAGRSAATPAAS